MSFGEQPTPWQSGKTQTVTFIVTENCQLRCKYCYMVGKNSHSKMSFDIARKTVDYLLTNPPHDKSSVVWEFIGGEPFLEIDLIEEICDYIKLSTYKKSHPWFDSYRFSFSTNGILYDDERVQRFIRNNARHLDIGITIDGTKTKHDINRVYPDGTGSYDDVLKNIPLWLKQFPNAHTKTTVSSEDLPYIAESVLHIWSLGIKNVNINVVFEDVWKEGDDQILEQQLVELADIIIRDKLYDDHLCSFFSKNIGKPLHRRLNNNNWCGAGSMLAVDHVGNFYPCLRFTEFSLQNRPPIITGNCDDGICQNKLRPFLALNRVVQSPRECLECSVASGCSWCQAANYDFAETDTIYQRATYLCKMHKSRVRANDYFWNKMTQNESAV